MWMNRFLCDCNHLQSKHRHHRKHHETETSVLNRLLSFGPSPMHVPHVSHHTHTHHAENPRGATFKIFCREVNIKKKKKKKKSMKKEKGEEKKKNNHSKMG